MGGRRVPAAAVVAGRLGWLTNRGGGRVSYRTFKHLLGETSLERKCRFIFGGGILTLVTFSFYWYGQKTEQLVLGQKIEAARGACRPDLAEAAFEGDAGRAGRVVRRRGLGR